MFLSGCGVKIPTGPVFIILFMIAAQIGVFPSPRTSVFEYRENMSGAGVAYIQLGLIIVAVGVIGADSADQFETPT